MIEKERKEPPAETKNIPPSQACGGNVSRTATVHGIGQVVAEDAALAAAQAAAQRACGAKRCASDKSCKYVEASSSGSSEPLNPAVGQNTFSATMTTTGSCQCE